MKTIGLLGGMSWESSQEYYRVINEDVRKKLGGGHSCKNIMYSVDSEEIVMRLHQGKWEEAAEILVDCAKKLEKSGAEFIVICSNTMHKLADDIIKNINIPLLHILDVTAEAIKPYGFKKVGLLGSRFTMEDTFYKNTLLDKHGIEVIIPNEPSRQFIHNVIFNELCCGIFAQSSKEKFKEIITKLVDSGAEGIILGCTEIPILIKQEDVEVRLFDTTTLHAKAAVEYSLST